MLAWPPSGLGLALISITLSAKITPMAIGRRKMLINEDRHYLGYSKPDSSHDFELKISDSSDSLILEAAKLPGRPC